MKFWLAWTVWGLGIVTMAAHALGATPPATRSATKSDEPGGFLGQSGKKAELLLLGVFHFDDQGLDAYKPRFTVDVSTAGRQRELERLAQQLAAFRPTKIAVEAERSHQPRLDSLYGAYLRGAHHSRPDELYQVGFRLAKLAGLARVHAVDAPAREYMTGDQAREKMVSLGLDMNAVMKRISEDPWTQKYQRLYARDDSLKTVRGLSEHLLYMNDPQRIRVGHGAYLVGSFKLGPEAEYLGPDDATSWYNRNLRIFSNVQAITTDSTERILLVIGAGHLPILRFLAGSSPEYRLREVAEFLER
jgi:hypothetical protein